MKKLLNYFKNKVFCVHFYDIDDLSKELNKMKVGCFVGKSLINHLLFADDLCCFFPSIHGLQRIIDVCHLYAFSYNIIFNCQKTL